MRADKKKPISRKIVPMKLDPIALEIHWKRLVSMVDEASTAFIRTSFSVLVR